MVLLHLYLVLQRLFGVLFGVIQWVQRAKQPTTRVAAANGLEADFMRRQRGHQTGARHGANLFNDDRFVM